MVNELVLPGVWAAEVRQGRWTGWCSHKAYCDASVVLDLFQDGFICPECKRSTAIVWPSGDMVAGIERLLLMRPHWKNRNWLPGETLHDLLHENAIHGILIQHGAALGGRSVFGIHGDRIVHDPLPTLNPRRELVR
jgi:hypothetical protein